MFIGLENINPDNLSGAKKKQNHIADYREMLQAWRKVRCITYCGYILGFPNDTPESIVRDIEIIQRELPLDILRVLLPDAAARQRGPRQDGRRRAAAIDPDLNKFDLEHVVCDHPRMTRERMAGRLSPGVANLLHRRPHEDGDPPRRGGRPAGRHGGLPPGARSGRASTLYNIYPLEAGLVRRKVRLDRRPGMPIESALIFYPRYAFDTVVKHLKVIGMFARIYLFARKVARDPEARNYTDAALTESTADYDSLEMFQQSNSARAASAKAKRIEERHHAASAKADAAE